MSCSGPTRTSASGVVTGRSRTRRPPDPFQAPCIGFAVDWRAAAARPGASRRSGYWRGLRALRKRGFIDDHSDAVLLRTPDALCRLL
jgi:hypothetical protein